MLKKLINNSNIKSENMYTPIIINIVRLEHETNPNIMFCKNDKNFEIMNHKYKFDYR